MGALLVADLRVVVPDDFAVRQEGSRLVCESTRGDLLQMSCFRVTGPPDDPAFAEACRAIEQNAVTVLRHALAKPGHEPILELTRDELGGGRTLYIATALTRDGAERLALFALVWAHRCMLVTLEGSPRDTERYAQVREMVLGVVEA